MAQIAAVVKRLPFTVCFGIAMVVIGIMADAHTDSIAQDTLRSVGYSPQHLSQGSWFRLVTCLFLTAGGWKFYASLAMFLVCVGCFEWQHGTRYAAGLFLGFHVATLVTEWFLLVGPLSWFHPELFYVLYVVRDVGPSAGYYGCLGALLGAAKGRPAKLASGAVFLALGLRLTWSLTHTELWSQVLPADLAHAIAYPLGIALGTWGRLRHAN